jgi:hypothetical protein
MKSSKISRNSTRSAFGPVAPIAGAVAYMIGVTFTPAHAQDAPLSPNVLRQIQAMTDEKLQRTDAQKKIDSAVLHAARAANGEAPVGGASDLTLSQLGAANLVQPDGRILVDITTTDAVGLAAQISSLGGIVISALPQYDAVRASLPATVVETVAAVPSVKSIRKADEGQSNRMPVPQDPSGPRTQSPGGAVQPFVGTGTTISEGVFAHGADIVQNAGVNGFASDVCVMSDGWDSSPARQAAGELPTLTGIGGQTGSGDEGTAMLELVADMAPRATLKFATAMGGMAQMAANIIALRNTLGCRIIVDDWTYFSAAAFQEDVVANAVTTVVNSGAMYFSSAANSGRLTGGNSGTWEGDFADGGTPPTVIGANGNVHSFGSAVFNTLNSAGAQISIKWSDPVGASANDYDLYIVNSAGDTILGSSTGFQTGTQNPYESVGCNSTICPVGARIYIKKFSGVARALRLDTHRGRLSIATNGSTFGHNGGVNTISVAAVPTPTGRKFNSGDQVETYSSDGPRRLFLNPVPATTAITPGCFLYSCGGGTTLPKVDIAASDCVTTTTPGFIPFCGTSAAAPQTAAIAALVKTAFPGASNAQVLARMKSSAIDIMAAGIDVNSGSGIVMADAAVAKAAHDFNGTARSDILFRNNSGGNAMWMMKGATVEVNAAVTSVATNWSVIGQWDFNGDGLSDILWGSNTGDFVMWMMNGASVASVASLGNIASNWSVVGVGDFDGPIEGITYQNQGDLLWRNTAGDVTVWTMRGGTIQYATSFGNVANNWSVGAIGDFNGDGASDILWRATSGDLVIWYLKGNVNGLSGPTVISTASVGNVSANWTIVGTADFNGDKKSDILWRNGSTGDTAMWLMNGASVLSNVSLGNVPINWMVASNGDYDGDGKGDILWHSTAGDIALWRMNGASVLSNTGIGNVPPIWTIQNVNAN